MDYIWLLWLITRLDEIKGFLGMCSGMLLIIAIVGCIVWFFAFVVCENEGEAKIVSTWSTQIVIIASVFMFLFSLTRVLIPSKEDAMYIAGGAAVIEAAQSDTAKRLASKSVKVVEDYLDKIGKEEKKNGNGS